MAKRIQQKRSAVSRRCRHHFTILALALTMSACTANGSIPGFETGGFNWLSSSENTLTDNAITDHNPALLANGSDAELAIYNAVELAEQKRFVEARQILAEVRGLQPANSDGFQALTCAMAIAALREGQINIFGRLAAQLDNSMGRQVRVDTNYVEVISLYRAINGLPLPVNAPHRFQNFKDRYFAAQNAAT